MRLSIHRCKAFSVTSHNNQNSNHIAIGITNNDGDDIEIDMYGLPADVTEKLIAAFSDADTRDYAGKEVA